MGLPLPVTVTMAEIACATCGMQFTVPTAWRDEKQRNGAGFVCPNGHSLTYGESALDRMRVDLDRTRKMLLETNARNSQLTERARLAEVAAQAAAESAAKVERARVRLLKRAAAGLCPCCNRTFTNLARHMQTKHKATT
jgi:hypothetical protein